MYKKTLLSLAVASSITLTGCVESGDDEVTVDPNATSAVNPAGSTWPIFDPATGALPLPNDLLFASGPGDGTFGVLLDSGAQDRTSPVTAALNDLSGASTVAPTFIRFNGQLQTAGEVGDGTPVYGQNVFLLEIAYSSGDPVSGLNIGETPTVAGLAEATVEVVQLDGTSAIRILPTRPLDPFKRYVAVVTNEVKDINEDPIFQSPAYTALTSETKVSGALAPIQTLINRLWEPLTVGFFNADGSVNDGRAALSLPPLTSSNIALSYSFTTSNDEEVLSYILDPTAYLVDTIRGQARLGGIEAAIDALEPGQSLSFAQTAAAADAGEDAFEADAGATIEQAAAAAAAGIATALPEGTGLPVPENRGATASFGASQDVVLVSALVSSFVEFGKVEAYQGTITTPYYLGVPAVRGGTDAQGAVINTQSWQADATIAGTASAVLGLDEPLAQADPSVSTVINYRFALPDLTQELEIPILVLKPACHDSTEPTIIYQHGITTDRSTALTFGSALANATCAAVVAIDHPVHGVTPFSEADQIELSISLLTEGALEDEQVEELTPIVSLAIEENDATDVVNTLKGFVDSNGDSLYTALEAAQTGNTLVGFIPLILSGEPADTAKLASLLDGDPQDATEPAESIQAQSLINTVENAGSTVPGLSQTAVERHFDYTASATNQPTAMTATSGSSGSLFINLTNFTNSRDKNRQSILDLVNLRMSLKSIDLNDDGTPDLNGGEVYFVGHSLGAITGIPFVSIANESATAEDDIVAASMLTPGGGIVRLLENSPSFAPVILGGLQTAAGLEQGDADLETFLNVYQAALDSADPVNFTDDLVEFGPAISLQQVNGDKTVPNSDSVDYVEDTPLVDNAFAAPLSGSEPLATLLGATTVNNANETLTIAPFTGVPLSPATITRYLGGTHGTPVLPTEGQLDERVFAEMVGQTISIVSSAGNIVVSNINGDVNPAEQDPDITQVVEQ